MKIQNLHIFWKCDRINILAFPVKIFHHCKSEAHLKGCNTTHSYLLWPLLIGLLFVVPTNQFKFVKLDMLSQCILLSGSRAGLANFYDTFKVTLLLVKALEQTKLLLVFMTGSSLRWLLLLQKSLWLKLHAEQAVRCFIHRLPLGFYCWRISQCPLSILSIRKLSYKNTK